MAFAAARQLDFYLGLPSLLFEPQSVRRELYGRAGACRITHYGVEYRVLGNTWLRDIDLVRLVYRNTVAGMNALFDGHPAFAVHGDITDVINTGDKDVAINIMEEVGIHYVV
jgi:hypothetical protein